MRCYVEDVNIRMAHTPQYNYSLNYVDLDNKPRYDHSNKGYMISIKILTVQL